MLSKFHDPLSVPPLLRRLPSIKTLNLRFHSLKPLSLFRATTLAARFRVTTPAVNPPSPFSLPLPLPPLLLLCRTSSDTSSICHLAASPHHLLLPLSPAATPQNPAPSKLGYAAAVERFVKIMAMVWAGSQVTKIVRAGGALALAPFVDKGLSWFTVRFKFESEGKAFAMIAGFCFALALLLFFGLTLLSA